MTEGYITQLKFIIQSAKDMDNLDQIFDRIKRINNGTVPKELISELNAKKRLLEGTTIIFNQSDREDYL